MDNNKDDVLFSTVDPRGVTVFCTIAQWNDHIVRRVAGNAHPELTERVGEIIKAIENPAIICGTSDPYHAYREVYHSKPNTNNDLLVRVVTTPQSDDRSEIITAFDVKEVGGIDMSSIKYLRSRLR